MKPIYCTVYLLHPKIPKKYEISLLSRFQREGNFRLKSDQKQEQNYKYFEFERISMHMGTA